MFLGKTVFEKNMALIRYSGELAIAHKPGEIDLAEAKKSNRLLADRIS